MTQCTEDSLRIQACHHNRDITIANMGTCRSGECSVQKMVRALLLVHVVQVRIVLSTVIFRFTPAHLHPCTSSTNTVKVLVSQGKVRTSLPFFVVLFICSRELHGCQSHSAVFQ